MQQRAARQGGERNSLARPDVGFSKRSGAAKTGGVGAWVFRTVFFLPLAVWGMTSRVTSRVRGTVTATSSGLRRDTPHTPPARHKHRHVEHTLRDFTCPLNGAINAQRIGLSRRARSLERPRLAGGQPQPPPKKWRPDTVRRPAGLRRGACRGRWRCRWRRNSTSRSLTCAAPHPLARAAQRALFLAHAADAAEVAAWRALRAPSFLLCLPPSQCPCKRPAATGSTNHA